MDKRPPVPAMMDKTFEPASVEARISAAAAFRSEVAVRLVRARSASPATIPLRLRPKRPISL